MEISVIQKSELESNYFKWMLAQIPSRRHQKNLGVTEARPQNGNSTIGNNIII